jgi:hypothetical protein
MRSGDEISAALIERYFFWVFDGKFRRGSPHRRHRQLLLLKFESMRHRPTDWRLQAAGEGVKQLDNKLVVRRTSNMEIQRPKDSRYVKNAGAVFNLS